VKLEQSFEVRTPIDRAWEALIDVERIAPCLPGAEITDAGGDGTYRGNFTVKLGPTTAAYRGELKLEEADAAAHRATMRASGQDKRGQGSAKATIVSLLREEGETIRVRVETDFTITGRLARFGRGGMIRDISNRLLRDFAACLQEAIVGQPPPAAVGPAPEGGATAAATGDEPAPAEGRPTTPAPAGRPTAPSAQPVRGLSLFFSVLWERILRLFRRRSV
jgi:uncharacterized protein